MFVVGARFQQHYASYINMEAKKDIITALVEIMGLFELTDDDMDGLCGR